MYFLKKCAFTPSQSIDQSNDFTFKHVSEMNRGITIICSYVSI